MKVLKVLFSTFALLALVSCASNTDSFSSSQGGNPSSSADTSSSGNSSTSSTNSSSSSSSASSSSSSSSQKQDVYYTVTFLNYDETPLQEVRVLEGEEAHYTGETPTKPEDDEYKYEFKGWDKDLKNIQSNVTTKAVFDRVEKVNWDTPVIWL